MVHWPPRWNSSPRFLPPRRTSSLIWPRGWPPLPIGAAIYARGWTRSRNVSPASTQRKYQSVSTTRWCTFTRYRTSDRIYRCNREDAEIFLGCTYVYRLLFKIRCNILLRSLARNSVFLVNFLCELFWNVRSFVIAHSVSSICNVNLLIETLRRFIYFVKVAGFQILFIIYVERGPLKI